ncbi:hypothetical protein ACL02T_28080 [Pseudonocardia sp. RS010]|uniref:hypothetical protein n=1 Tax=Pseudonocardia sp. RS010 TaxID=3385979 RepID=UPI00399F226B
MNAMGLLSLPDFYRLKYRRPVEVRAAMVSGIAVRLVLFVLTPTRPTPDRASPEPAIA